MIRLILCLLPGLAWANPHLDAVRDLRGGGYEALPGASQQVEVVRGGAARPAVSGLELATGDAVRTARGAAAVVWDEGDRLEIGDGSQVRLDAGPVVRVGEGTLTTARLTPELGGAAWVVAGTIWFRATVAGDGAIVVLDGQAGTGPQAWTAGTLIPLTAWTPGEARPATLDELDGIETWRRARFAAAAPRATRRDRAWVGVGGGFTWLDRTEWGIGTIDARGRLLGPLWLAGGVGVALRPTEQSDPPAALQIAVPLTLGPRVVVDLPASLTVGGGADFLALVAERCRLAAGCDAALQVDPGVRFALEAAVLPHARVGLGLQVSGGLVRRLVLEATSQRSAPWPFAQLEARVFLRL